MSRNLVGIVADCHIGNRAFDGGAVVAGINQRGQISLDTFKKAIDKAFDLGAKKFIVAGDLFHYCKPEPSFITQVSRIIEESGFNESQVIIIPGNHDQASANPLAEDTACDPLYLVATIIHAPTLLDNYFYLPFSAEKHMTTYIEEELEKQGRHKTPTNLVIHVGVYDNADAPWCATAKDAIHIDKLARKVQLQILFCG